MLTGLVTTSLLQSSSATTVMAVSFVNARILALREAVGIVMGANIGTTITAWVIAFAVGRVDIRELALPMIAIALPLIFIKRSHWRYTGEMIIGFALMFIGLQLLQGAVPALKETPQVFAWFETAVEGRFASPVLFVLIGTIVAGIVQSSTAAIALTVALMANGVITLEMAAAMVLGENIGTTVTANLAAIVANREAQRTARVHTLINVIGATWMVILLPTLVPFIDAYLEAKYSISEDAQNAVVIAVFHTGYNLLNVAFLVGFSDQLVRLSARFVRATENDKSRNIEYIGSTVMATPELAILEVEREMRRFARVVAGMNNDLIKLLDTTDEELRAELLSKLSKSEEKTDRFKKSISAYLTELAKLEVANDTSLKLRGLMGGVNNLERIGDLYYQIALNLETKNSQKVYFIPRQRQSLKEMSLLVGRAFEVMHANLDAEERAVDASEARVLEQEINDMRDELRNRHLQDVTKDRYSQSSGIFYSDTFSALEEIADQIFGVTEGLSH